MRTRIWAVLIVFALLLAACGTGAGSETTTTAPPTTTAPTTTATTSGGEGTTTTSEATEAFDLGVDKIGIGVIAPFSGPVGFLGVNTANSVQVEVDRINAAGGIGGAQLEVVTRDSELNPQLAVEATQELVADNTVNLVIGPAFTGLFNAAKETLEEAHQVNCQMLVSGGTAIDGLKYTFRDIEPDQFRTVAIMDYLASLGVKSVAIVYEEDDTGKGYAATIPQMAADRNMTFVGTEYTRLDDQTHRAQIEAVKDADAILISNNAAAAAKSATAAADIGYQGILFGFSGLTGFAYVEATGDPAEGTLVAGRFEGIQTNIPESEWPAGYRAHVNEVVAQFGETTGPQTGVRSYNGATIGGGCVVEFAEALKVAKSLDPDALVAAWETLDIPFDQMPDAVEAKFGPNDHESYGPEDVWIYRWTKASDGTWFLDPIVTPPYWSGS